MMGDREFKPKIECTVEFCTVENARGNDQPAVRVKCPRCDHTTESFGQGENSVRRCLALMREECPMGEDNFYTVEEDSPRPDWWSKEPPRGLPVETPEVLRHENLPLKPPGRR